MQYIAAVWIDHRYRCRGRASELLAAVVAHALAEDPHRPYAAWVVHPANDQMLRVSDAVGDRVGSAPSGHVMYVNR